MKRCFEIEGDSKVRGTLFCGAHKSDEYSPRYLRIDDENDEITLTCSAHLNFLGNGSPAEFVFLKLLYKTISSSKIMVTAGGKVITIQNPLEAGVTSELLERIKEISWWECVDIKASEGRPDELLLELKPKFGMNLAERFGRQA